VYYTAVRRKGYAKASRVRWFIVQGFAASRFRAMELGFVAKFLGGSDSGRCKSVKHELG
jgi:hypothetical protein